MNDLYTPDDTPMADRAAQYEDYAAQIAQRQDDLPSNSIVEFDLLQDQYERALYDADVMRAQMGQGGGE